MSEDFCCVSFNHDTTPLGIFCAVFPSLLEILEKRGVSFASHCEGVVFRTPDGKLVMSILAAVAAMEREMLREWTKAGLPSAQAQGRFGGPSPVWGNSFM